MVGFSVHGTKSMVHNKEFLDQLNTYQLLKVEHVTWS